MTSFSEEGTRKVLLFSGGKSRSKGGLFTFFERRVSTFSILRGKRGSPILNTTLFWEEERDVTLPESPR